MSAGSGEALLAKLARLWGLTVRGTQRVRKVWRLQTERGCYCLKKSILSPCDLLFVESAVLHLRARGFTAVLPAMPALSGAPYVCTAEGTFVLYPWLQSREADFDRPDDLSLAARVLTELHEASRGFIPYRGDVDRVRWGLWPQIFTARRNQLFEFGLRASVMARASPFCARYAHLFPYYYAEAGRALASLAVLPYGELCREAVRSRTICHHDFSARNLLIDEQGRPFVVDFDYCLADLRLHDLANFILRLLRHGHWRPETAATALALYHRHSPLDDREYAVLYALLLWPQDFWQIGLQFFLEELPWSQERYLQTLRRKTDDRADRAAFLNWYRREYLAPSFREKLD